MFVKLHSKVTVDNLLHGVIIQSGNDASVALAEHMAGSEDAFVDLMNKTAQELDLENTHFMNATGLPHENHYSTAHDMAKLARAIVYEDPAHYSIYSKKEFKWNNINQPNRNLLLWRDSTVDGLKTGHTEEAGYCMVASAKRDNIRLIAAVFGTNSSNARASETQKILTYGFRFYQTRTFYKKGDVLAKAMVWKGTKDEFKAGLSEDLSLTLPKAQIAKLKASMVVKPQLMAPIKAGDVVGRVNIKLKDKKIYSANLIALESVEEAGFFGRFIDSIRLFFYGLFN
ncbi:UNVERIFIED_CONTAM: hypothetical protein GTU68_034676 [Idotea baltica]|nr:hypothetical protein [Idotea baltica]